MYIYKIKLGQKMSKIKIIYMYIYKIKLYIYKIKLGQKMSKIKIIYIYIYMYIK